MPSRQGFVSDFAGRLSEEDRNQHEQRLRSFHPATAKTIAVAIVPSLGGETVESYANRLFRAWGIGQKDVHNGVLLLWAPSERKARIEVGIGLEALLPQDATDEILASVTSAFRTEDYVGGLNAGIGGLTARMDAMPAREASSDGEDETIGPIDAAIVTVALIIPTLLVWRVRRSRENDLLQTATRTCPRRPHRSTGATRRRQRLCG